MPKFGIIGSDICITTAAKISEDGASGRFTDMAIIAVSRLASAWAPMTCPAARQACQGPRRRDADGK